MEAAAPAKVSKGLKITLIAVVIVLVVIASFVAYRLFFEFNKKTIEGYIIAGTADYSDKATASRIMRDGVQHILSSKSLTDQVKEYAKASNIPCEKALVDAAILQAKAYGYL